MTIPSTVTPERLQIAISALVEIQAKPKLNGNQVRLRVFGALDALAPEIAMMPAMEAYELTHHAKESRA